MADVPLQVISENSSSERRITPSWTISQLKAKLESITGIPPMFQSLFLKKTSSSLSPDQKMAVAASEEGSTTLAEFPLVPYAELHVIDTRPPSARPNYTDTTGVEKYTMAESEYEKKTDSVLAWKKAQKLGRFDPNTTAHSEARKAALEGEARERGIEVGRRCRVGGDDMRRGQVMYVGEVPEIPAEGLWVGIRLDDPVGKNDGSVGGKRYWSHGDCGEATAGMKYGVFVRPDRVEMGEWPPLNDLEDMEEI